LLELLPLPSNEGTYKLSIDWARCDGHGVCAYVVPELIHLDRNGFPIVLNSPMPPWVEKEAKQAVAMCPALALRLTGEPRRAPTPSSPGDELTERPKNRTRTR
jgi:ferredoxin